MKLREITTGAVLTALAIIIPIQFAFLKIIIPPFTATLASHVPMFIAMVINPTVAVMVGVGSTIGFLLTSPAYIAARAASHIVVGLIGAMLIKKGKPMLAAFAITAPIHAVIEALAVIPFGWTAYQVLVVTGVGTLIHHTVDAAIATSVIYLLNPLKEWGWQRDNNQESS
jgi:niacin transporter